MPRASRPINLNLQVDIDQWENATSTNWTTPTDWSSPAGVPTSADVVMLDAPGTFKVTSNANETVYELDTVSTATLAVARGTALTVTNGTGAGVQAGTLSVGRGATLNISGAFDNTGTIWAQGGVVNVNGALSGGATVISGAGWVVMGQASSENISYNSGTTGGLVLGRAPYSGWISGFGSNTTQSIDLTKLKFAGARLVSYDPNGSDTAGILTISTVARRPRCILPAPTHWRIFISPTMGPAEHGSLIRRLFQDPSTMHRSASATAKF